jgi:hypothetical protein
VRRITSLSIINKKELDKREEYSYISYVVQPRERKEGIETVFQRFFKYFSGFQPN